MQLYVRFVHFVSGTHRIGSITCFKSILSSQQMHVHDSPRMAVTVVCFSLVAFNMFLQMSLLGGQDVVVNGLHAVQVALSRLCSHIPLMFSIKPLEPLLRQEDLH
jgi:hypothetical protein